MPVCGSVGLGLVVACVDVLLCGPEVCGPGWDEVAGADVGTDCVNDTLGLGEDSVGVGLGLDSVGVGDDGGMDGNSVLMTGLLRVRCYSGPP